MTETLATVEAALATSTEKTATAASAAAASLLPDGDVVASAKTEAKTDVKTETKTEVKTEEKPAWFYAEGVPGKGEPPEWLKTTKYKTLEEQAKAYPELEKRFGAFTGAPKEGKYEAPPVPEGLEGEFITDHPIFDKFQKWALDNQVSQQGYNAVLGMLAEYEASRAPDMAEIKKSIGEDADARITAMTQWAKANLDADGYGVLRAAMSQENAADVLKAFEQIVAKTREPAPKPGPDVPPPGANKREEIEAMQGKLGPDGKRLYDTDPKYRAMVEQKWTEFETARMSGGA